jgi:hypothetical protein
VSTGAVFESMLMNPNQETWASPKVYKLTWWLVVQQALACLINQNKKNSLYTPTKEEPDLHEDSA